MSEAVPGQQQPAGSLLWTVNSTGVSGRTVAHVTDGQGGSQGLSVLLPGSRGRRQVG